MEREQWIGEVLNSANGIKKRNAPDSVLQGIYRRIEKTELAPANMIWLAAACLAAIIAVNIMVLQKPAHKRNEKNTVVTSDNPFSTSNQLY